MKNNIKYAVFSATLVLVTPVIAEAPDCYKVATVVKNAVASHPEKVLELVAAQVAQNDSCACEVVKAAIVASDADKELVAEIVTAAIEVAPEKVRIIGQCAVAVAPDALAEVQAVVTQYDAASGDSGFADAKGGDDKGGKGVAVAPPTPPSNPLDFPLGAMVGTANPVGPTVGGPGGFPLFPPGLQPPTVIPPTVEEEEEDCIPGIPAGEPMSCTPYEEQANL